jgi:hypothetical protein
MWCGYETVIFNTNGDGPEVYHLDQSYAHHPRIRVQPSNRAPAPVHMSSHISNAATAVHDAVDHVLQYVRCYSESCGTVIGGHGITSVGVEVKEVVQ